MAKKRILIYAHRTAVIGGVEKVLCTLINNLDMNKYDITLLLHSYYHRDINEDKIFGNAVKYRNLGFDLYNRSSKVKLLLQRIHIKISKPFYSLLYRFKRFDIAIAFQEGRYAKFIQNVNAKKKYVWVHVDMSRVTFTREFFKGSIPKERKCYERFDKVVCVSDAVRDSMEQTFGPMNNLCVCHNPIDTLDIDKKIKAPLDVNIKKRPLLVSVGRLCYEKAFDRLLNVIKRLSDDGYVFDFWIIGDGHERPILEEQIKHLSLTNVTLLGMKENPYIYIKEADWILTLSRHEGFNLVLFESLYLGKAILSSDFPNAKKVLGDNEYGIVAENDEESIYVELKKILSDKSLQKKYEDMALIRKDLIDLNEQINKIEQLF